MGEIRLIKPTMEYAEDIMKFRQEIFDAKDEDAFAGCGTLEKCETAQVWIDSVNLMENPDTCPKGRVSGNVFLAVRSSDNKIVGMIDLRHHLGNPVLRTWGGHFGYIVRPDERRKGYAKEMVRLNLEKCRELGLHKVMITCDRNNIASERTILANGGVFEKEVPVDSSFTKRFWVTITESMLKTTQNTRELGGYVIKDGLATRRNSLWRSDVQCYPSKEDVQLLKDRGITTIIDLRGEKDTTKKPSGFANKEGFHYINCPVEESSGVPESVEAVPVSYLAIACAKSMPKVFKTIANAESGVMFNCTAGKDRTGVVSAILLLHAGVDDSDIIENYVLTREYGRERLELVHKNFPEIDMNIVTPREWFMEEFLRLFRKKFGTTEQYFKMLGLGETEIGKITGKLVG
ncbi:MAG: GNAT family N-acetyltransferase [Lachnospiraceae bacterium]|nr:GNAT family N-acetyltransferase [Lachnospiraceae bacterium]